MDISFATKELEKCGNSVKYANKKLGDSAGRDFL